MKFLLPIVVFVVAQATLGNCEDNNYGGGYDCSYMWMMMNGGPQMTGLSVWMLLCLGITALLFSTDITSVSSKTTKN